MRVAEQDTVFYETQKLILPFTKARHWNITEQDDFSPTTYTLFP
jgi:hypothetical protein